MEPLKCEGIENRELCKNCPICQKKCHRCKHPKCKDQIGEQITWEDILNAK